MQWLRGTCTCINYTCTYTLYAQLDPHTSTPTHTCATLNSYTPTFTPAHSHSSTHSHMYISIQTTHLHTPHMHSSHSTYMYTHLHTHTPKLTYIVVHVHVHVHVHTCMFDVHRTYLPSVPDPLLFLSIQPCLMASCFISKNSRMSSLMIAQRRFQPSLLAPWNNKGIENEDSGLHVLLQLCMELRTILVELNKQY